jgi:hypothetical protein
MLLLAEIFSEFQAEVIHYISILTDILLNITAPVIFYGVL